MISNVSAFILHSNGQVEIAGLSIELSAGKWKLLKLFLKEKAANLKNEILTNFVSFQF